MVLSLNTVKRVDELVARTQADGRVPSVIAAVVRDGTVAHVTAAGEVPSADRDTQYRIGSITKSLTAAVVLRLRDEGLLSLDDPLVEYLHLAADVAWDVGRVRVRELLAHAAGMQREPDGVWWERSAGGSLATLLEGITAEKLAFGSYGRFHYSNLAYGLLGGLIERLTGESWWDAVSERVLRPLGMARTTYDPQEPFARGYVVHPWHHTLREEPRHDAGAMAPAGQLWSTAQDLSRWAAALAAPNATAPNATAPNATAPNHPVPSAAIVSEMASPAVIADPDAWTDGYGLGLQLWRKGERIYIGHTGSMPGYLAVLAVHRGSSTGVVAFANAYSIHGSTIGQLGLSILDAVIDNEPTSSPAIWRPGVAPPADIELLCGRWWWMGREFEARWDSGRAELVITGTRPAAEAWRFVRLEPDRWLGRTGENAGEVLNVLRDEDGAATALDIATFVFTRDPLPES